MKKYDEGDADVCFTNGRTTCNEVLQENKAHTWYGNNGKEMK